MFFWFLYRQEKIHRVHDAARDGGLLAMQQALDRRKFAIAKDDISPNGSTPLHVAVLFGHTGGSPAPALHSSPRLIFIFMIGDWTPSFRHRSVLGLPLSGDHDNYG